MAQNEFGQPVSADAAPAGSKCGWCGKPAIVQLTVIGGTAHNQKGLFCLSCGETFKQTVGLQSQQPPS